MIAGIPCQKIGRIRKFVANHAAHYELRVVVSGYWAAGVLKSWRFSAFQRMAL